MLKVSNVRAWAAQAVCGGGTLMLFSSRRDDAMARRVVCDCTLYGRVGYGVEFMFYSHVGIEHYEFQRMILHSVSLSIVI